MAAITAQRIMCDNTPSGNPRRGWIVCSGGRFLEFVREEFYGESILTTRYPDAHWLPGVNVIQGEYKRLAGLRGVEEGQPGRELVEEANARQSAAGF